MENFSLLYKSLKRAKAYAQGLDSQTRDISITLDLFNAAQIPFDKIPSIAVTGSKGKGSTSILTSAILEKTGKKVGLVSSPHLVDFCERIRINGQMISEKDFLDILTRLAPIINKIDANLPVNKFLGPTGIILACAIIYFAENQVDIMVLEAGRGGRFDETNLLPSSVTCLTPIMNEHLDKLGPTVLDVAWNKVGLTKSQSIVVSATQTEEINNIILSEVASKNATLFSIGKEIFYQSNKISNEIQEVNIQIPNLNFNENIKIKSQGVYQGMNLAVATGATVTSGLLNDKNSSKANLSSSLLSLRLPGRCETINENPKVIIDGAINRFAAAEFKKSVSISNYPSILITSLPDDKDAEGLLAELAPLADHVIITTANSPILSFTNDVENIAKKYSKRTTKTLNSNYAFEIALTEAGPTGTIWVVGTQSLVRDALLYWNQKTDTLWYKPSPQHH